MNLEEGAVHRYGRDEILGLAHSDHGLVVFLEAAGAADPETVLDEPLWAEWRGGRAHEWTEVCEASHMRQQ
ncbi:hypothetical protein [Streptomyces sp. NPDC056154]|uniref:hypothetical protein n=1 Tax=unclassified Streptomyces TaxID=2593676 RepID=UPI0035DE0834